MRCIHSFDLPTSTIGESRLQISIAHDCDRHVLNPGKNIAQESTKQLQHFSKITAHFPSNVSRSEAGEVTTGFFTKKMHFG